MKKLLSLALALTLMLGAFALTLVSCGEEETPAGPVDNSVATLAGKTPEELYNAAAEELADLTNFTATSSQVITMNIQGLDMEIIQTVVTKATAFMNQSVSISNVTKMSYGGEVMEEPGESYAVIVADGLLYTNKDGKKIKAPVTEDTIMNYMPEGSSANGSIAMFPPSFFEGTKFKPNDDGTYTVAVTMNAQKYTEYFGDVAANLGGTADIKKVVHNINFDKDGNLIDVVTDLYYSVTVQGVTVDAVAVSTTVITDIGTTAVITAPADADSYVEGYLPTH